MEGRYEFAVIWVFIGSQFGPSLVAPGMSYAQVAALVPERPTILNRTGQNWVREAEYTKARQIVTFDEGRVVRVRR